jgi:hypothetical protein
MTPARRARDPMRRDRSACDAAGGARRVRDALSVGRSIRISRLGTLEESAAAAAQRRRTRAGRRAASFPARGDPAGRMPGRRPGGGPRGAAPPHPRRAAVRSKAWPSQPGRPAGPGAAASCLSAVAARRSVGLSPESDSESPCAASPQPP